MSVVPKMQFLFFFPNLGEKSFVLETVKHAALRIEGRHAPPTEESQVKVRCHQLCLEGA